MITSEQTDKLFPSLLKASEAFRPVVFDSTNPAFRSKYASLPAYLDAITPALRANGLLLTQATIAGDPVILQTRITHCASSQWIASEYPVHPVKRDPQGEGSALTYARRYALSSLLGLAADDDDGNSASQASKAQEAKPEPVSDEAQAKAAEFRSAIADATSVEVLTELAAGIGKLPKPLKDALKPVWAARRDELAPKVEA